MTTDAEWRECARQLANALTHMSCHNCDDRKCMGCVMRDWDHECADDCMECCELERVHSPLTERYGIRAEALAAFDALEAGCD